MDARGVDGTWGAIKGVGEDTPSTIQEHVARTTNEKLVKPRHTPTLGKILKILYKRWRSVLFRYSVEVDTAREQLLAAEEIRSSPQISKIIN